MMSEPDGAGKDGVSLRGHLPGDVGWIIHRHGLLYAKEFGYDEQFEALVAQIGADFLRNYDPNKERCWIAERSGEFLGCVVVVRQSDDVAKLRLLLVEPAARGLGIGKRLVTECVRFARATGYKTLTLWTQSHLLDAARVYRSCGFVLVHEEATPNFGREDLVAQVYELTL